MFKVPEKYRIKTGPMGTLENHGNVGAFRFEKQNAIYFCIASDCEGWEHVSLSISVKSKRYLMPTWDDMCLIKSMFWDDEDAVMQFHPPKSEYVNNHNYVLHLWRECNKNQVMPPSILVGIK